MEEQDLEMSAVSGGPRGSRGRGRAAGAGQEIHPWREAGLKQEGPRSRRKVPFGSADLFVSSFLF